MSNNVTKIRVKGTEYDINTELYTSTGYNEDGSMTQKSITNELVINNKENLANYETDNFYYTSDNTSAKGEEDGTYVIRKYSTGYVAYVLPTTLVNGKNYTLEFDYISNKAATSNKILISEHYYSSTGVADGWVTGLSGHVTINFLKSNKANYARFAISSITSGTIITISNLQVHEKYETIKEYALRQMTESSQSRGELLELEKLNGLETTGTIMNNSGSFYECNSSSEKYGQIVTYGTDYRAVSVSVEGAVYVKCQVVTGSSSDVYRNHVGYLFLNASDEIISSKVTATASTGANNTILIKVPENAVTMHIHQLPSFSNYNKFIIYKGLLWNEFNNITESIEDINANLTEFNDIGDRVDSLETKLDSITVLDTSECTFQSSGSSADMSVIDNGDGSYVVVNNPNHGYLWFTLPAMEAGKRYRLKFHYRWITAYASRKKENWYWVLYKSDKSTKNSTDPQPYIPYTPTEGDMSFEFTQHGWTYLRFAGSSQWKVQVEISNISIENFTSYESIVDKVNSLSNEDKNETDVSYLIEQASWNGSTTNRTFGFVHFSDVHADLDAVRKINNFINTNQEYIDDVFNTGDSVKYWYSDSESSHSNTGKGVNWWKTNCYPQYLFVLGNHDGALPDSCDWESTEWNIVKKDGGTYWDAHGKDNDFLDYFADYITDRGITMPAGYDDPTSEYYHACYWKKDYPKLVQETDASDNPITVQRGIRVIGLDCIHNYDNYMYLRHDQETWLAQTLAETLDENNEAYGLSVIFLSHYPIDNFSGPSEEWDDTTHKFIYNNYTNRTNNTGGYVVNRYTGQCTNFHNINTTTLSLRNYFCLRVRTSSGSLTETNEFANIINNWLDNGGQAIAWMCGHLHVDMMFYSIKCPRLLTIVVTSAGGNANAIDTTANRTGIDQISAGANYYAIDTKRQVLKIVRFGYNIDSRYMVSKRYISLNYKTGVVYFSE